MLKMLESKANVDKHYVLEEAISIVAGEYLV
jgi:hypothetical protein